MKAALTIGNINTYHTLDLRMLKRNIGAAPKDSYKERVPFSSVTYDFGSVCGKQSYGERTLTYQFELMCFHVRRAQDTVVRIINEFHWEGRRKLIDDLLPDYYFMVSEPAVSFEEKNGKLSFSNALERAKRGLKGGEGVKVVGTYEDHSTELIKAYDPAHPDADDDGYVYYPNVNIVTEMTDLIDASRSYEANATAFKASKEIAVKGLEMASS